MSQYMPIRPHYAANGKDGIVAELTQIEETLKAADDGKRVLKFVERSRLETRRLDLQRQLEQAQREERHGAVLASQERNGCELRQVAHNTPISRRERNGCELRRVEHVGNGHRRVTTFKEIPEQEQTPEQRALVVQLANQRRERAGGKLFAAPTPLPVQKLK